MDKNKNNEIDLRKKLPTDEFYQKLIYLFFFFIIITYILF